MLRMLSHSLENFVKTGHLPQHCNRRSKFSHLFEHESFAKEAQSVRDLGIMSMTLGRTSITNIEVLNILREELIPIKLSQIGFDLDKIS